MQLLRISPSKVETWRKYHLEEYNGFITKEKVIEALTGTTPWTPEATFGSAFHLVMQHGAGRYVSAEVNNEGLPLFRIQDHEMPTPVILTYQEIALADKFHLAHPGMVWEVQGTYYLDVDEFRIMIPFRIDAMEGQEIHENKTSTRDLQYDFFEESMQWKIYLLATRCPKVQVNVFSYDEPNTKRKYYEVYQDHLTLYPYEDLQEDVRQGIRGLITFCKSQGLMGALEVKRKPKPYYV